MKMNTLVSKCVLGFILVASLQFCTGRPIYAVEKALYFTFDDGPSQRFTPLILNVLKEQNVKATFFVLGSRSEEFPQLVHQIVTEGHAVGSHGYYHEHITRKPDDWVFRDIYKADDAIRKAGGVTPTLYRPPGGLINLHESILIREMGHPIVLWTVDSFDWKAESSSFIVQNVMKKVAPGSIVLFHDGISNSRFTVEALPSIINQCRKQGYTFKALR